VEERRKGEERGAEGRRQRPSKKKKTQQFFMEKKRWAKNKKGENSLLAFPQRDQQTHPSNASFQK
jgi:hypothetical protein